MYTHTFYSIQYANGLKNEWSMVPVVIMILSALKEEVITAWPPNEGGDNQKKVMVVVKHGPCVIIILESDYSMTTKWRRR